MQNHDQIVCSSFLHPLFKEMLILNLFHYLARLRRSHTTFEALSRHKPDLDPELQKEIERFAEEKKQFIIRRSSYGKHENYIMEKGHSVSFDSSLYYVIFKLGKIRN